MKVSVCMPCYNAAPFLAEALESVLGQTYPDLELIVVNDGSTDSSGVILKQYKSRGVRVVEQPNQGQCAAANRALEEASGELIKFVDADDVMSPEMIEKQMERLGGRSDAVASAKWGRFFGNDFATFRPNPEPVWKDMGSKEWLVESWRKARPMMQCGLWLIPRQVLESCGGWNERLSLINDFEFFARVLCTAEEVLFTPGAQLYYRSGIEGSLSGSKSRGAVESAFESLMLGTGHLLERRSDEAAKRASANMLQDFVYTYYPNHPDLLKRCVERIEELGGSDLEADGPPRFLQLKKLVGWKVARRIQRLAGR